MKIYLDNAGLATTNTLKPVLIAATEALYDQLHPAGALSGAAAGAYGPAVGACAAASADTDTANQLKTLQA